MKKRVSIVTVCYNEEEFIEETILSVIKQTFKDYEYIIIDGGSTDNTLNIINKYSQKITKVISEKDHGIYNAMNKGLRASTGEYMLFLNAKDRIYNESVLEKIFEANPSEEVVYGDVLMTDRRKVSRILNYPKQLGLKFILSNNICHQAIITKRELYYKYGNFDESFKYYADYDFLLRILLKHNCSTKYMPFIFSIYDLCGITSDNNKQNEFDKEWYNAIKNNCNYSQKMMYFVCQSIHHNPISKWVLKQNENNFFIKNLLKIWRFIRNF